MCKVYMLGGYTRERENFKFDFKLSCLRSNFPLSPLFFKKGLFLLFNVLLDEKHFPQVWHFVGLWYRILYMVMKYGYWCISISWSFMVITTSFLARNKNFVFYFVLSLLSQALQDLKPPCVHQCLPLNRSFWP